MFTKYTQVIKFLDGLGLFHMDLSLNRVKDALNSLKLNKLPFKVVQLVGTNGKGSTSTFLNSIAHAHNIKTGLFTSPHFVSPSERILCSGKPLSEDDWINFSNEVHIASPNLTYFEFLTVLAVFSFVKKEVELVILEAGLGGRSDATTAIARDMLCITPISLDHEGILGNSIASIACDKAAAMGQGMNVYYAPQLPAAMNVLQTMAAEQNAMLIPSNGLSLPLNTNLGLKGTHQKDNALLALAAWQDLAKQFKLEYDEEIISHGLERAFIAGRLHSITPIEPRLPKRILLDGAHNEQGLQVLNSALSMRDKTPNIIIFSCMGDKNIDAMLPRLKELHENCNNCPLIIVGLQNNERALNLTQRQTLASNLGSNVYVQDGLIQALDYACKIAYSAAESEYEVLICGSLYLLGEFFELYPHYIHNDYKV